MKTPEANESALTPTESVGLADAAAPRLSAAEDAIAIGGFRLIERFLLIVVALMTMGAVAVERDDPLAALPAIEAGLTAACEAADAWVAAPAELRARMA